MFQSAPRDFSRGDQDALYRVFIDGVFQSAPRDFSRGDLADMMDVTRDSGFNPRPVISHGAIYHLALGGPVNVVSIRAP